MADETLYEGAIRILYIKDATVWHPVACLSSNPISEFVETIPTTTRASGGWETSVATSQSYTIDFEGIQILTSSAGDDTKLSYDTLKEKKRDRTLIEWKIEDTGLIFSDTGSGYITAIGEANEVGGLLTFNGTIQGYGL